MKINYESVYMVLSECAVIQMNVCVCRNIEIDVRTPFKDLVRWFLGFLIPFRWALKDWLRLVWFLLCRFGV
jgi:hypothetical protein